MSDETKTPETEEKVKDVALDLRGKKYSSKRRSVTIEIDGVEFTMESLTGHDRASYINFQANRHYDDKGNLRQIMTDHRGVHEELIHMSLKDDKGKRIPKEILMTWDGEMLAALFDDCETFNGLNKKVRDIGKKDSKEKDATGST